MVVVALGNLVGVPTDFKVGGVHHEVAEVVDASRFEKGLIAVVTEYRLEHRQWCQSVEVTREAVALQFGDNVHLRVEGEGGEVAVGVVVIAECHALIVGEAVKVWSHRALQSYHLTLPLAVDVVAAYLSAGGLGGFALAVLSLNLCHTEDLQTNETKKRPPRRAAYNI